VIPRLGLAAAGVAVALLPAPAPNPIGVVLVLAGLTALVRALLRPDGPGTAVVLGLGALSWLVFGADASPARLVLFALATATAHSSAALAAGIPRTARLDRRTTLRWAARTVATTAVGSGVVAATALLPRTSSPATTVAVAVVAVTGAVVAAAVLALRRPAELTRTGRSPDR
jgi:hypothetical protein